MMIKKKFNQLEEELKENMQKQFNKYQENMDKKNARRHRNN
jgi:hypothetical protein